MCLREQGARNINDRQSHWDAVYGARNETALTWFEAAPDRWVDLIAAHVASGDPILDVGAGASRLVDALLARGLGPVTVLDISPAALAVSQARLGKTAQQVTWLTADITRWTPAHRYAFWHDRAVFHFLTDPEQRAAYVNAMILALKPGGFAAISSFALDGPETCSNLPVQRYSPDTLWAEIERLAPGAFERIEASQHDHITPKGNHQHFQTTVLQKRA